MVLAGRKDGKGLWGRCINRRVGTGKHSSYMNSSKAEQPKEKATEANEQSVQQHRHGTTVNSTGIDSNLLE